MTFWTENLKGTSQATPSEIYGSKIRKKVVAVGILQFIIILSTSQPLC